MIIRVFDRSAQETVNSVSSLFKNTTKKKIIRIYSHKENENFSAMVVVVEQYYSGNTLNRSDKLVDAYMENMCFKYFETLSFGKNEKPKICLVSNDGKRV